MRRFLEKAQNKHDHPTPDTRNFDTRTTYDNHYTGSRTVRGFQKIEVGRSRNTAYFHKRPARILTRCESAHATCVRVHGAYRRRRRPVREVGGARGDGARRPLLTPWLVAALECTHRHFFAIGLQDSIFFSSSFRISCRARGLSAESMSWEWQTSNTTLAVLATAQISVSPLVDISNKKD